MLNISNTSISKEIYSRGFNSFKKVSDKRSGNRIIYFILAFTIVFGACLFLPWTQNIRAKGYLSTLSPQQKPQAVQSVISGRLEEWFVREGDLVAKGDTIAYISEVKSDYFDPELVNRTDEQVRAKAGSADGYRAKANSLKEQYRALEAARDLKREQITNKMMQTRVKIESDSIDLIAFQTDADIAKKQLDRTQELFDKGLKSLTQLEEKRVKYQQTQAKVRVQQNKVINLRNELGVLKLETSAVDREYADKLAKSESDRFSALTAELNAEAETSKLKNQLSNYTLRQDLYYIKAPQAGFITKTIKKGIGEIIKEGADIMTIVPDKYDFAVEIYVEPYDLPLLSIGNEVRLQFDGWPAFIFSGWPNTATGTFPGKVVAIDRFISDNGKYRILIAPEEDGKEWPELLRMGSGAEAFILLKRVPLWYEIWRQLNGFPADFYTEGLESEDVKKKAPLRSVK